MSLGRACARRKPSAVAQLVAGNIPFLAPRDHCVEDDDELAHAGGERNLRLLAVVDQAAIEGLEHGIVPGRGPETGHVEEVADPAAAALDVALALPSAAVVIVRRSPQQGGGDLVADFAEVRPYRDQSSERC